MKLTYTIQPGCTIEQEVRDTKQAFEFVAYAQEVFGVKKCGHCESLNVRLRFREPQGYQYYSVACLDCRHELAFGQQKDSGKLFPKGWQPGYQSAEKRQGSSEPQYSYNEPEPETARPTTRQSVASGDGSQIPW